MRPFRRQKMQMILLAAILVVLIAAVGLSPTVVPAVSPDSGVASDTEVSASNPTGLPDVTEDEDAAAADEQAPARPGLPPLTVAPERPDAGLQREIASYVSALDGTYGVVAYDFATGRTVRINDNQLFPSASLYKLIVLYQAYEAVENGDVRLDDEVPITRSNLQEDESSDLKLGDRPTVAEALDLMVTISSNTAAHALLEVLGREEFNSAAVELGLGETRTPTDSIRPQLSGWRRYMASTSPRDLLRFFQLLATRELIDREASDEMLAILFNQQVNDRIPAGLPVGTRIAHKTGELNGVRNDAGIVLTDRGAYVLAVLSQNADEDEATVAAAEIARRVHAAYGEASD